MGIVKILSLVGMGLGVAGTIISNIASSKQLDEKVEDAVKKHLDKK